MTGELCFQRDGIGSIWPPIALLGMNVLPLCPRASASRAGLPPFSRPSCPPANTLGFTAQGKFLFTFGAAWF